MHSRADGALRWALISLGASLLVLALKLGAWWRTESAVLLADAAESLLDLVSAGLLVLTVRLARRPADPGHPYGHGKAEYFSSGFQGALIFAAGVAIIVDSLARVGQAPPPLELGEGLALSVAATIVNLALALALLRAGRRLRSPALRADGAHTISDVMTTLGGWLGLLLAWALDAWILDPLFALLVAANILRTGVKIAVGAVHGLMDASLPADEITAIETVIRGAMGPALEFHDLRTRRASQHTFVELHLVVDGEMSVEGSHALCDAIEAELRDRLGVSHTTIHVEPESERSSPGAPAKR